jgi:hypothetical protein
MVGRDQILSDLAALLADAHDGRGRSVLLLGEPGIGKSTLAAAVAAHGTAAGFRTARGWCSAAGMPAYWPWRRALQACGIDLDTGADRHLLLSSLVRGLDAARPMIAAETVVGVAVISARVFLPMTGATKFVPGERLVMRTPASRWRPATPGSTRVRAVSG